MTAPLEGGPYDVVLRGGRAIDPESGLDAVRQIGIADGKIATVTEAFLEGRMTLEVGGLVVAPGFVDLHSHAQTLAGRRLQACDGVTAALDLEAGRSPVAESYSRQADEGSPIHYGFSASWAAARARALTGELRGEGLRAVLALLGSSEWRGAASEAQSARMLEMLSDDLAAGAVGVGLLMGYAPEVDPAEYLRVSSLAASAGMPTFTHTRELVEHEPATLVDGAEELVRAAAETGVHAHYCHVNSTSLRQVDRVLDLVARCRAEGGTVTTEAYPYGSGATAVGAVFLDPEVLASRGLAPSALVYLPTGERIADARRLTELRASDPAGLVIVDFLDEQDPADRAVLQQSLSFEGAVVASDAMPAIATRGPADEAAWPLPDGLVTHPRSAGCFSRTLRLCREGSGSLAEALGRCSLLPARVLEASVPAMRVKGRLRPGADADLVVFDPATVSDQATYEESTRPSTGIRHVLVGGTFVVRDGALDEAARPGRPLRSEPPA